MYSGIINLRQFHKNNEVSFARRHEYSRPEKNFMKALRKVAEKKQLPDFYTGKKFNERAYPATIEHLVPHHKKRKVAYKRDLTVNAAGNIVLAGNRINSKRGNIPLKDWYGMYPEYIENGKKALSAYEEINIKTGELFKDSPEIDGKKWGQELKTTLNSQLGYIAFTGRQSRIIK